MKPIYLMTICVAFLVAATSSASADTAAGKAVFEAKGCGECHYVDGPAKEKTIDDQLAKRDQSSGMPARNFKKNGWRHGLAIRNQSGQ